MRLGGRLAAAIDILHDIDARRRPAAEALKDWGLSHRFAGSGDRAAIGNIVHDALRKRASHAWSMEDDTPAALAHAVMLRQWGHTPESLAAALEGDRFAPPPLAAAALGALAARDLAAAPAHVRADVPAWTVPSLQAALGENWIGEAAGLAERPPLDLRVNTLKASREKVVKALSRTDGRPQPVGLHGLRFAPPSGPGRLPNVTAAPAFHKGWFEVQDAGSQLAAARVGAAAGEQVLDFCAGGGGKTLALAAAMGNRGQVHAHDADPARLAPIVERLRRAGTRNVQLHETPQTLEALKERFDRVVVDAPCTGSGTWRRRPDTKWRLDPRNLTDRTGQQDAVLDAAHAFVRPGGLLVYITCSLLAEENADRVAAFVERHPDFAPPAGTENDETGGAIAAALAAEGRRPLRCKGGAMMLTPATSGTDGFFVALLRRRS